LPQTSAQTQTPSQNLSTITKGLEHATFDDIPEVQLQHPTNNVSTTQQDEAKTLEVPAQPKPIEVPHINRSYEHLRQFKSSKKMQSWSKSK
jgi:hypothetical protein